MTGGGEAGAGGTYALLVSVPERLPLRVGALGEQELPPGGYAYVGSALGRGGFARVDRHRRVAAGEHGVRHWHIDHLLGHPAVDLADVARWSGADVECAVARALLGCGGGDEDGGGNRVAGDGGSDGGSSGAGESAAGRAPVPGFGASDCDCPAHLARRESTAAMAAALGRVDGRVG